MKKIKIIALFLTTLIIASCSNNDYAPITSENNIDYFNFSKENQNIVVGTWKAYRTENNIEVSGNAADGTGVYCSFNKFGNIIRIGTIPASGAFGDRNNYQNFSSNYFNFSLASLDEANKRVTVINGEETAQIMLFNGLSRDQKGPISHLDNPYQQDSHIDMYRS